MERWRAIVIWENKLALSCFQYWCVRTRYIGNFVSNAQVFCLRRSICWHGFHAVLPRILHWDSHLLYSKEIDTDKTKPCKIITVSQRQGHCIGQAIRPSTCKFAHGFRTCAVTKVSSWRRVLCTLGSRTCHSGQLIWTPWLCDCRWKLCGRRDFDGCRRFTWSLR